LAEEHTAAGPGQPPSGPPAGVALGMWMWCPRHLRPYRAAWPQGFAVAMVRLFDAAARMQAVADFCRGDAGKLTDALVRFAPACCFIPGEALQAIYDETVPPPAAEGGHGRGDPVR
jgi:hypothetical protein